MPNLFFLILYLVLAFHIIYKSAGTHKPAHISKIPTYFNPVLEQTSSQSPPPIRPRSAETYPSRGWRAPQSLHLTSSRLYLFPSFQPANVVAASPLYLTPPAAASVDIVWLSAESLSGPCSQRKFLKITPFPVAGCIQAMMGGSKSAVVGQF